MGETLNFQVRVITVRRASDDELLAAAKAEASDSRLHPRATRRSPRGFSFAHLLADLGTPEFGIYPARKAHGNRNPQCQDE